MSPRDHFKASAVQMRQFLKERGVNETAHNIIYDESLTALSDAEFAEAAETKLRADHGFIMFYLLR